MKPIPILVVNLKGRPENTFDKTHFVNDEWFDNPEWWHFEKNVQWHDCPLTKDGEYTAILVWQYQITHGLRKGEWEYFLEQYEHKLFNKSGAPERQIWRIVPQPQEPSDRVKKLHAMSIPMKEGDRFKKEEQTMEKLSEQDLIDQPKEQVIERQFKNNCDYGFKQRNVNSFIRMAFESGFENGMNYQKYNSDLSKPFPETIAQVEAYDKKSGDPDINFPIDEQWSHLKARMDREKEEAKTVEEKPFKMPEDGNLGNDNHLYNCPFCNGSEKDHIVLLGFSFPFYRVSCTDCGYHIEDDRKDKVKELWNTRNGKGWLQSSLDSSQQNTALMEENERLKKSLGNIIHCQACSMCAGIAREALGMDDFEN